MLAKSLRTKRKSASAERCVRPLGATIDMATPDIRTSNHSSERGIFALMFTKRQPGFAGVTGFCHSPGIAGNWGRLHGGTTWCYMVFGGRLYRRYGHTHMLHTPRHDVVFPGHKRRER